MSPIEIGRAPSLEECNELKLQGRKDSKKKRVVAIDTDKRIMTSPFFMNVGNDFVMEWTHVKNKFEATLNECEYECSSSSALQGNINESIAALPSGEKGLSCATYLDLVDAKAHARTLVSQKDAAFSAFQQAQKKAICARNEAIAAGTRLAANYRAWTRPYIEGVCEQDPSFILYTPLLPEQLDAVWSFENDIDKVIQQTAQRSSAEPALEILRGEYKHALGSGDAVP